MFVRDLDRNGILCCQRVLGRQPPMRPQSQLIAICEASDLGYQLIAQCG